MRSHTISEGVRQRNKQDVSPVQPAAPGSQAAHTLDETRQPSMESERVNDETRTAIPHVQVSAAEVEGSGTEGVNSESSTGGEEVKDQTIKGDNERVKSKLEGGSGADQSSGDTHSLLTRTGSVEDSVRLSPGFRFITRPDLYKFAKVSMCRLHVHF